MLVRIKSESLCVDINPIGAELYSLHSFVTGSEYLWQGDPKFWERRAPVLFPIVGRLKDGSYTYDNKEYHLLPHGFAGNAEFDVIAKTENTVTFELTHSPETLAIYPFDFAFQVKFELSNNTLNTIYHVQSKNESDMWFSVGSHEAYRCPLHEGEGFEDYYVEFGKDDTYLCHTLSQNGLLTGKFFNVLENDRVLPLSYEIFEKNDSLVFENFQGGSIFLKSRKTKTYLEVGFGDATDLVLWTMPGAPYICIEAWNGLPDFEIPISKELCDKKGIIHLKAGESLQYGHSLTIHELE